MFNADTANAVLITFGAIGGGLLAFVLWMGLRYFFGWGYADDNYQSARLRPNRRLTDPGRLTHLLRKA